MLRLLVTFSIGKKRRPFRLPLIAAVVIAPLFGGCPIGADHAENVILAAEKPAASVDGFYWGSFRRLRNEYFTRLDEDPVLRVRAHEDSLGALMDLTTRDDVPPRIDRRYTRRSGSAGGGRLLLTIDYTRGFREKEPWSVAVSRGIAHLIAYEVFLNNVAHFKTMSYGRMFPGDETFIDAFRDSGLTGGRSCQVGHLMSAVKIGVRAGMIMRRPVGRKIADLSSGLANRIIRLDGMESDLDDEVRAIFIGHEMSADGLHVQAERGFVSQFRDYSRLVADGDTYRIRHHFDRAVEAVIRDDHETAWIGILTIAEATGIRGVPSETGGDGGIQQGNSLQDLALSVYGYATGLIAAAGGFATPEDLRNHLEDNYSVRGRNAVRISRAAGFGTPPTDPPKVR